MRLDELSSVVRLQLRTMVDSSSRRIMRPLDKNGQCQSNKNSGRHGFAGYEETDIRVWKKHTLYKNAL